MMGTTKGKILKGVGGLYTVRLLQDESREPGSEVACRARGAFRHEHLTPLPGDFVDLERSDRESDEFVINRIEERKNVLIRPPVANLDYLFVTMAASHPAPILTTQDKLLAIAEANGIEPIVVITKCDLDPTAAQKLYNLYVLCGFSCFTVSSVTGDGTEELRNWLDEHLPRACAAFAGASGIGKSTLMNRLFPALQLSTSEISRKIERGRHTTRQVQLFPLSDEADCGYLADTPGFSMLDFERFDFFEPSLLPSTMREFRPYLGQCKYTKCSHTKEEGCAVLQALHDGKIPPSRHASYVELYEILKKKKKWN